MASKENLSNLFEEYGFELGEDLVEKCFELSVTYNIEAHEFVEIFVAYCVNNNNGAEPTTSTVDDFERKELSSYKARAKDAKRNQTQMDEYEDLPDDDGDEEDVMEAYICTTPKANKKMKQFGNVHTPRQDSAPNSPFAGQADSPISGMGKDVAGKVVVTFGNSALFKTIDAPNNEKQNIVIERYPESVANNYISDQDYMFDTLSAKAAVAADRVFDIGQEICAKLEKDRPTEYSNLLNNMTHVGVPNQTTVKCVGRICSDNDYKLDTNSTLLIGADEMQLRSARLNFNRIKSFALFPGQTVFVQGLNLRGDTFFVDEIHSERALDYAELPKLIDDLSIVIASGPFTPSDDLSYEPLTELLAYCAQHKPDVLILIGPFLDAEHQSVRECSMKQPYGGFFESLMANIVEVVGQETEVLIVSSSQDVHSSAVYPTYPYTIKAQTKNMTFLPDPCIIKVNGVMIALTATDVYNHILDMEIALNAGDKIKRISNYLFNQGTFYPLNPPSDEVCLDSGLSQQFAALPIVPNILVLPSTSKCFARGINNCLVLNPGKLVQTSTRGTFGRVKISAKSDTKSLNNVIGCQIIKI